MTTTITYRGTEWMEQASRVGVPGFTGAEWFEQVKVCADCPVKSECLEFGLSIQTDYCKQSIVYGGLTNRKLTELRRQRKKENPPVVVCSCAFCSTKFEAGRRVKYCSRTCRDRAYQRTRKGQAL